MFPPGKSRQNFGGFKISRFAGSLCRYPGKCLYISKDFSGTDIYHSDIKKCVSFALLQIKIFGLTKNYFSKFAKF